MVEVIANPTFATYWQDAIDGKPVDWDVVMDGYAAAVDWPAAAFWRELADANPDAIILLSTRSSADAWWKKRERDDLRDLAAEAPPDSPMHAQMKMAKSMFAKTFTPNWPDEAEAKRAYEHTTRPYAPRRPGAARRLAAGRRLGADLPARSNSPFPSEPFPHVNITDDFRAMLGLT